MIPTPTNPGLMVGSTFLVVALASLIWGKVAHWAMSAVRTIGMVD